MLPALFQAAIDHHARLLHHATARRHRCISHPLQRCSPHFLLQRGMHQREIFRMEPHRGGAAVLHQHAQCLLHHRLERQGVHAQFLAHHLARNLAGQFQHALRHVLLQVAQTRSQSLHDCFKALCGLLALSGHIVVHALLPLQRGLGMALRLALGKAFRTGLCQLRLARGFFLLQRNGIFLHRLFHHGVGTIDSAKLPLGHIAHFLARNEAGIETALVRRRRRHHRLQSRFALHPTGAARS